MSTASSLPSPSEATRADFRSFMRAATAAHAAECWPAALSNYSAALSLHSHPQALVLYAIALVTAPCDSPQEQASRTATARSMATRAQSQVGAQSLPSEGMAQLEVRIGYFKLCAGEEDEGSTQAALRHLEAALALCAGGERFPRTAACAWSHIGTARRRLRQHDLCADAYSSALSVLAGSGAVMNDDRGYHDDFVVNASYARARALRAAGRHAQCVAALVDVVTRMNSIDRTPAREKKRVAAVFWLRVALAHSDAVRDMSAEDRAAARALLEACGGGSEQPPAEYVRSLFDGYAATFDEHLVNKLGYATPQVLMRMACDVGDERRTAAASSTPRSNTRQLCVWQRAADLGCGTGLAGVYMRPRTVQLHGVDLSPGMVAQARARCSAEDGSKPLYDELAVGDVVDWCTTRAGHGYDLVVAADVLVYIGDLAPLFTAVTAMMRRSDAANGGTTTSALPAVSATAPMEASRGAAATDAVSDDGDRATAVPALLVLSTEADLDEAAPSPADATVATDAAAAAAAAAAASGYRVSHTGRCVHAYAYVTRLAAEHGFELAAHARQAIRRNAGVDVIGDLYVWRRLG